MTKPNPNSHPHKKRYISLAILAVLTLGFLFVDLPERHKFAQTKKEAENLRQLIVSHPDVHEEQWHEVGDGTIDAWNCFPDEICPFIFGSWTVPIEEGKEKEFVLNFLEGGNYNINDEDRTCVFVTSCTIGGKKEKFDVIGAVAHTTPDDQKDKKQIDGKIWRRIQFRVTYTN